MNPSFAQLHNFKISAGQNTIISNIPMNIQKKNYLDVYFSKIDLRPS